MTNQAVSLEANKRAVLKFIEYFNAGEYDRLAELAESTFVWESITGERREGLDKYIRRQASRPSNERFRIDVEDIIAEKDRVVVRLHMYRQDQTIRRTHDIYHVVDGLIIEEWSGHE